MKNIIELNNISVDIPIFDVARSFRKSLVNRLGGGIHVADKKGVCIQALKDINLSFKVGDRVGLIGHNGAGKTTLLRLLAHIYKPTRGRYFCGGKITALFNTSIGIDMDDTGAENVETIGMFLGMSKQEVAKKRDSIIEFSELGDFIHLPVRTYSSGMLTRLSFAIATSLEPDVMLMDEGIGAGDARFADKAEARLKGFYSSLKTLVLASHSNELIRQLCNKAVLMEHGQVKAFGDVDEVLALYAG